MPNYTLYCADCDNEYNIRATIKEKTDATIPCPNCGTTNLSSVFKSAPAYVKGAIANPCPKRSSCGSRCPHAG